MKHTKHSVIYVPGLGDSKLGGQYWLVSTWRIWGVKPHIVPMHWSNNEDFEAKLQQITQKIDSLKSKGHRVSLVGASAGAGAVINAFTARKADVNGVVLIAGKVNNPDAIGPSYRHRAPAFVESAFRVQSSLDNLDFDIDRPRIQSRIALFDPVIPAEDSRVAGGRNVTVWSVGHSVTIALQLIFGAPWYLRFLNKLDK